MKEKTWYVYAHFTKDTNELFYIGVGTGRRAWDSNRNALWCNIVNKHGYSVEIILEGFIDRDEAVKCEVVLQILNKPRACFQYGDKHNVVVSSETREKLRIANLGKKLTLKHIESIKKSLIGNTHTLGFKHSIETKKKMSESRTGRKLSDETKKKIADSHKGKKHKPMSKEVCAKLSELRRGVKKSPEHRANMGKARYKSVINCRGEIFKNMNSAKKAYNAHNVSACCRGVSPYSGKYSDGTLISWSYYNII